MKQAKKGVLIDNKNKNPGSYKYAGVLN